MGERFLSKGVSATDERGPGNANHEYAIYNTGEANLRGKLYEHINHGDMIGYLTFQKGPIKEVGVNGFQNEDLLEIVADRLTGFQTGNFACEENWEALCSINSALVTLRKRTQDREARNVEGTNNA